MGLWKTVINSTLVQILELIINFYFMKRRFIFSLAMLVLVFLVGINVKAYSHFKVQPLISADLIGSEMLLDGVKPKCVELGLNYPGKQSHETQFYCSKSGKTETSISCDGTGPGCQEVKRIDNPI